MPLHVKCDTAIPFKGDVNRSKGIRRCSRSNILVKTVTFFGFRVSCIDLSPEREIRIRDIISQLYVIMSYTRVYMYIYIYMYIHNTVFGYLYLYYLYLYIYIYIYIYIYAPLCTKVGCFHPMSVIHPLPCASGEMALDPVELGMARL